MPAYISHAIMGTDLYNSLSLDDKLLKIQIDINDLRGFSLGADLAYLSKKTSLNPHNYYTQAFFLNMINYIRENKMNENEAIMALLYGHMAHYFLDINIHPLVYYIECGCKKVGIISNHFLVEGYYDSYLADKRLGIDIMDIKSDFFNQIDLSNKCVVSLLNTVYGNLYNDYNIVSNYKRVLSLFSLIEKTVKCGLFTKDFLIKFAKFKEFMNINSLTCNELINEGNYYYKNPLTGKLDNKSLLELYYQSLDMCLDAIKKVNNYLYKDSTLSSLENVFTNLSYDTGVSCSLGKTMQYTRKRV